MARTNFKPWQYGDRESVTEMRKRIFDGQMEAQKARREEESWYVKDSRITALDNDPVDSPVTARPNEKKKGRSLFDTLNPLDDIVDAGKDLGKLTLKGLGLPQEYVGKPAFAVLSGQTEAERKPIRDGQGNITGYYREKPGFGDMFGSIRDAVTDPVGAYKEGREAFDERLANPEQNALSRSVLNVSADPLNLVGPGLALRLVRATGATGKGARVLTELLDSGGPGVIYGGAAGVAAVEEYGETVPGFNKLDPTLQMLIGAVAGGVGGGAAMRAGVEGVQGRGPLRGMGGSIIEEVDPVRLGGDVTVNSAKYPGTKYDFRYRVVDMDDLVTSHTDDLNENPLYNQAIQPRNRDTAASADIIGKIAAHPDQNRFLAETFDLQNGIPIIGPDGLVESGNGRVIGLRKSTQLNPEGYATYRAALDEALPRYGLRPEATAGLERPVLVRERITEVDRPAFAEEANESTTQRMGDTELASVESGRLPDDALLEMQIVASGRIGESIRSAGNQKLRNAFIEALSPNERASLVDADGALSQAGVRRMQAAIFRKTYSTPAGQRLTEAAFESTDDNARNVQLAMQDSLAQIAVHEAEIRAGLLPANLSIANDVAAAADAFARIKEGTLPYGSVDDYLLSASMFDDMNLSPNARMLLKFMDMNTRSAKPLREFLRDYTATVKAAAGPQQTQMGVEFVPPPPPDQAAIMRDLFVRWDENASADVLASADAPTGSDSAPSPDAPTPEPAIPTEPIPSTGVVTDGAPPAARPRKPRVTARPVQESTPAGSEAPVNPSQGADALPAGAAPATRTIQSGVGTITRTDSAPVGGRETGGPGTAPEQPVLLPEAAGDVNPPRQAIPGGPTGRQQPTLEQLPGDDLIDGKTIDELSAGERRYQGTRTGKVDTFIRKLAVRIGLGKRAENLLRDPAFTPVWNEANRIENLRQHIKAQAENLWYQVDKSGLELEQADDGNWYVAGTNQMLGDVVEHATPEAKAVWDGFSPETRAALDKMTDLQERARQTVEKHGGEMPIDDSIEGSYWHRKVVAKAGQEKTSAVRTRRRPGSKQAFQRKRTAADMTNAAAGEGLTYAHPLDSFTDGLDQKLKVAGDAYISNLLKPLVVPNAKPGFGFTEVPDVGVMADDDAVRAIAGRKPRELGTIGNILQDFNSVLTPIRASFDASGLFQQGMRRFMTDPGGAVKDWKVAVQSLKDDDVYRAAIAEYDEAGPGLEYLARRGYRVTAEGTANEVTRLKDAGDDIPGFLNNRAGDALRKGQDVSSKLYDRPLNLHRISSGNAAYKRFVAQGLEGKALDEAMDAHGKATNRMYGWTGTKPSTIESVALFAPRYFRSNIETILKAVTDGGIEGTEARKHLALMAGEAVAVVTALNAVRGKETEFDPRSNNFMRVRDIGGLDVSPFGSYDTLLRFIAGTVGGDDKGGLDPDIKRVGRLLWGKSSPSLKLIIEPLRGETYLGKPLDPVGNPVGFAWEQFKSSIPFGAQNLIEGVEDGRPADALVGAGIGSLGLSQNPLTATERRDAARASTSKKLFGKDYDDLTGDQKAQVNGSGSVSRWQDKADDQSIERGGERAQAVQAKRQAKQELAANAEYLAAGKDAAGNPFRPSDYRDAYHDIQQRLLGARSILEESSGGDKNITGWFDLYDKAKMANGQVDYLKLEQLQAEFERSHPGVRAQVDAATGVNDDATLRELRRAQKEAGEYYAIPAYRGMTVAESRRASDILALASNMVAAGEAPSRNAALGMLRKTDPAGATLARKALVAGSNKERIAYRRSHPLFAKWYLDVVSATQAA